MSGKLKTVYKVYGEQDKSGENKPECPAIGSLFPHPWLKLKPFGKPKIVLVINYNYITNIVDIRTITITKSVQTKTTLVLTLRH